MTSNTNSAAAFAMPQEFEMYATVRVVLFRNHGQRTTTTDPIDAIWLRQGNTGAAPDGFELATNGESDIASLGWNKDTDSPAGVLSMVLFPRRDYKTLINPEDVLFVFAKGDKYTNETFLCIISVDTVTETRAAQADGATIRRFNVQGRDLGKILMETPLIYDSAFGGQVMARFFSQFVKAFTQGTAPGGPSLVVQTMLAIFFSLKQNFVTKSVGQVIDTTPVSPDQASEATPLKLWQFPGTSDLTLPALIDTHKFVQTPMVGALTVNGSLLQSASNLWALCDMYANRLVNEFFIDTRDLVTGYDTSMKRMGYYAQLYLAQFGDPGTTQIEQVAELAAALDSDLFNTIGTDDASNRPQPADSVVAVIHRQLPYDTYSFYALPTSIVYETEVFSNDTGLSSHDVHNMFRVRFADIIEGVSQDLQFGVAINRDSIARHGLRRFDGESIYVWTNALVANSAFIVSARPTYAFYMSLVTTWYAYNEYLQSGSITMRFRPDIRCGTRLTFFTTNPDNSIVVIDYYVQRVQHSFVPEAGGSRTTVDVVRGISRPSSALLPQRESHLFWTNEGGALQPNPYEVVLSEDDLGVPTQPTDVPATNVAPSVTFGKATGSS